MVVPNYLGNGYQFGGGVYSPLLLPGNLMPASHNQPSFNAINGIADNYSLSVLSNSLNLSGTSQLATLPAGVQLSTGTGSQLSAPSSNTQLSAVTNAQLSSVPSTYQLPVSQTYSTLPRGGNITTSTSSYPSQVSRAAATATTAGSSAVTTSAAGSNSTNCQASSTTKAGAGDSNQPPTENGTQSQKENSASPSSPCGSVSSSMVEEVNLQYLKELQMEKEVLEGSTDTSMKGHTLRLLETEINHIQSGGSKSTGYREPIKYLDIYRERPIRLTVRSLVPVREHPKFNFVGKLLGPKGNSMKRLQEETMTKMAVLGKGSMRDKQKEEELRLSNDPKYQHLHEDLHVEITAFAPPAEAHARIAYALTEIRKYLIPDSNDEIRQEQMREMEIISNNGDLLDLKSNSALMLNGIRSQQLAFTGRQQAGGLGPVLPGLSLVTGGGAAGLPVHQAASTANPPPPNAPSLIGAATGFALGHPATGYHHQLTAAGTGTAPSAPTGLEGTGNEQYQDTWSSLKAVSAKDNSKHRVSTAPYPKQM